MKKDSIVLKYKSGVTLFDNHRYTTICNKISDELKLRADEIGLLQQGEDMDGNEFVIIRVTFKS